MWYFDEVFQPTSEGRKSLLKGVAAWLASPEAGWLFENMPCSVDRKIFVTEKDPSDPPGRPKELDSFERDPVAAIRGFDNSEWNERGGCWDFRDEEERQEIVKVLRASSANRLATVKNSVALGLQSDQEPARGAETVFVSLGGARMAPLMRTRMLAEALPTRPDVKHFILLGTNRPLNTAEIGNPNVEEYRREASTEFELMQEAGREELGIDVDRPEFDIGGVAPGVQGDPFFDWRWKLWEIATPGDVARTLKVHAVQAPTTRPGWRAHTGDSLQFLAEMLTKKGQNPAKESFPASEASFNDPAPKAGALFALSTSAIYRSVQHLDAVRVLEPFNFRVHTIGHPIKWNQTTTPIDGGRFTEENLRQAISYLQEVRGTINAALRLVNTFEEPAVRT